MPVVVTAAKELVHSVQVYREQANIPRLRGRSKAPPGQYLIHALCHVIDVTLTQGNILWARDKSADRAAPRQHIHKQSQR